VVLSWDKATDNETPANGISYTIYLGKSAGNYDVTAPCSFVNNGVRKIVKSGNVNEVNSLTLNNLPEGKYYWSTQSIDNNFEGSAFAAEKTFTICHNLSVGQDTSVCKGDTIKLHAGTPGDVVNWYSLSKGVLATNTKTIDYKVDANDKIVVELTNALGCVLHDTINLTTLALPSVKLGNDTAICYQKPITLNVGSGWSKISWYKDNEGIVASNAATYTYNVSTSATFIAAVTDGKGCKNRDTIYITKNDLPSFTLGTDKSLCFADTAKLSVSKSFPEIKWYKANNGTEMASGVNYKYPVTQTDTLITKAIDANGCKNNDTIVVHMYPLPDIKLSKDTSICFGDEVTIKSNKKFLQRITEEVTASGQALDDIIWSVNTNNDNLDQTLARMRRYSGNREKCKPELRLRRSVYGAWPPFPLDSRCCLSFSGRSRKRRRGSLRQ
jgi:hypothetical protein